MYTCIVSCFPLHFMLYLGNLDCFSNSVVDFSTKVAPSVDFRVKLLSLDIKFLAAPYTVPLKTFLARKKH